MEVYLSCLLKEFGQTDNNNMIMMKIVVIIIKMIVDFYA